MVGTPRPKVLLFDIGGVCVLSPFKAILEYEDEHKIPKGYINFSIRELTPHGSWHQLERGEILCNDDFFRAFKAEIENPKLWAKFQREKLGATQVPAVPNVDAESLYWTMMSTARSPDPYMEPALRRLKANGQYKLAAMSNTTIFPEGHEFNNVVPGDVKNIFELFVSSAHVGMRKPNRDIYEYTMKKIQDLWGSELNPRDVVFLDDIGENLKMGRNFGFRTIRVFLGKTDDAVRELEKLTGLELLDHSVAKAKL